MKKSSIWVLLLALGFVSLQCKPSAQSGNAKTGVSIDSVIAKKIQAGALVVDVRTPGEYASGHFKGAINIPVSEVSSRLSEFGPKDKPIVVYCASGARSGSAKQILERAGYKDVTNGINQSHLPSK